MEKRDTNGRTDDTLQQDLEAGQKDPEFMATVKRLVERNREILDRLAEGPA